MNVFILVSAEKIRNWMNEFANLCLIGSFVLSLSDLSANLCNRRTYFFVSVVPDNGFDTYNVRFVVEMNVQVRGNHPRHVTPLLLLSMANFFFRMI
jgi:hypothetical protein